MKKLILPLFATATLTLGMGAGALAATPLPASYRAVYCYPGGTYWQKQIAAYPDYYAANNAYYVSHYGAATRYCPTSP